MWFLLVPFILILIPDLYIWSFYIKGESLLLNISYWIPLFTALFAAIIGFAGYLQEKLMRLFFMILLCIAIPKVIFTIVSITGKGVSPVIPYADIYANSLAFLLAILAFLVSVYGFN